jgi:hypothetical protein
VLKDKSKLSENLFKPNLKSFIDCENKKQRLKYIVKTIPALNHIDKNHDSKFIPDKEIQKVEHLKENIKDFTNIIHKLDSNDQDIVALRDFIMENEGETAKCILDDSIKFTHDIQLSPDYQNMLDSVANAFNNVPVNDVIVFFQFTEIHPELSLLLLHPCLISVLGNVLFLKYLLPLTASDFSRGPLHNWSVVRKEVFNKIMNKKWYQSCWLSIKSNKNVILTKVLPMVTTIPLFGSFVYSYLFSPTSNRTTARQMLDKIPKSEGFERFGINLTPIRNVLEAAGIEVGRLTGAILTGFIKGHLDKSRPFAEQIADRIDKQQK